MPITIEQVIESIQKLPTLEQEKVWQWLEKKRQPQKVTANWGERVEKFQQALRWIEENRQAHLGQWVCLDGDKLISHGNNAKQVYADAKAKGIQIPFIEQVGETEPALFWGGWD